MKYITDIIKDDYKEWPIGSMVFISSPTGSGKSTFIIDKLLSEAQRQKKYLVYIANRRIIDRQIKSTLETQYDVFDTRLRKGNSYFIGLTYQYCQETRQLPDLHLKYDGEKLTAMKDLFELHPNDLNISREDVLYYVFDECHYIISDAHFNRTTNYWSIDKMWSPRATTICLSATPESMYGYLYESVCHEFDQCIRDYYNSPNVQISCMEYFLELSDIYMFNKSQYRKRLEEPINLDTIRKWAVIHSFPLEQLNYDLLPKLQYPSDESIQNEMAKYPYTNRHALEYFYNAMQFPYLQYILWFVRGIKSFQYTYEADYSYFDSYYFDEYPELFGEIKKSEDKWLVFVNDSDDGQKLSDALGALGVSSVFIDSETKSGHDQKAKEIYAEIVESETYSCQVLVTTSLMECGVTLKDLKIKNIVISQSSKASFLQMLGRVRRQSDEERIRLIIRRIVFQTVQSTFSQNESVLRFMSDFHKVQNKGCNDANLKDKVSNEIDSHGLGKYLCKNTSQSAWYNIPFRDFSLNRAAYCRLLYDQGYIVYLIKNYVKKDLTFFLREQLQWISHEYSEDHWFGFREKKEELIAFLKDTQTKGPIMDGKAFQLQCMKYIALFNNIFIDSYLRGMVDAYKKAVMSNGNLDNLKFPSKNKLNKFFIRIGIPYMLSNPEKRLPNGKRKRVWVIEDI